MTRKELKVRGFTDKLKTLDLEKIAGVYASTLASLLFSSIEDGKFDGYSEVQFAFFLKHLLTNLATGFSQVSIGDQVFLVSPSIAGRFEIYKATVQEVSNTLIKIHFMRGGLTFPASYNKITGISTNSVDYGWIVASDAELPFIPEQD